LDKAPNSRLTAVLAFFTIIVLGESVALLMDYSNNAFLQQYVSANASSVATQIGVLAAIAIVSAFLVYRRATPSSITVEEPRQAVVTKPTEVHLQASQGWFKVFSDTRYLFVRSLKKLLRNPILLFFSLFQPIIFILLFTQLFSSFGSLIGGNYTQFAVAGIVLQNGFSSAFQSGTSMVDDLRSGFLVKMLATPVSRSAILLGRISTDMFRMVVQSSIIFFLAFLLGAYPYTGIPGYLLMLATIAFFGLAWSGISLSIGLKTRSAETVFGIAGTLTFPLLFMSTALVPGRLLPQWMKDVSQFNPISITVDAIRAVMVNDPTVNVATTVLTAFGVIAAIGVVTIGATLYLFKKVVS
jgi:ABC-2 type transport system permease protein